MGRCGFSFVGVIFWRGQGSLNPCVLSRKWEFVSSGWFCDESSGLNGILLDGKGPGLVSVHREGYGVATEVCAFPSLFLTSSTGYRNPMENKTPAVLI